LVAGKHGSGSGAEGVEGKKIRRGAGGGKADGSGGGVGQALSGDGGKETLPGAIGFVSPIDKTAAPDLPFEEAVGFEEFIGGGDGGAIQAKETSQFAGWREAFAIGDGTGADLIAEVLV
jgi:hypothetical protein